MPVEKVDYYYKFVFTCKEVEVLTALLDMLSFNGFETQGSNILNAYADSVAVDEVFLNEIEAKKEIVSFSYTKEKIESVNWNATWEKDFKPVMVDDFCVIRADFHAPFENTKHEIVITPQMSFGTGHHETTRSMAQMMRSLDFKGKKVLDFGCGTGVLSILAHKMGANEILGVDIDNNAYINSIDNCKLNEADNIQIMKGDLTVTDDNYDIILANINRHVILNTLPSLSSKLTIGNHLLISGILHTDIPLFEKHLRITSLKVVNSQQLNDWMCILTEKV